MGGLAELWRGGNSRGAARRRSRRLWRESAARAGLPDDLKDTPENELGEDHAAQVELYRRRAEAFAEAYGDDAR